MAQSVFLQDLNMVALTLRARLAETLITMPPDTDLPVDDPEEVIILLDGTLALIEPALDDIVQAINDERVTRNQFKDSVKKLKGVNEVEAADAAFDKCYTDLTLNNLMKQAKDRQKALIKVRADVEVRIRREKLVLRTSRATTPPVVVSTGTPQSHLLNNLPARDIPLFDGKVEKFTHFYQMFEGQVDNTSAPDIQKFSYLVTRLSEDVKQKVLQGLDIVESNYKTVKDRLVARYGQDDAVLRRLRQLIFDIPPCQSNLDVRNLYYYSESLITQMETILAKSHKVLDGEDLLFFLERRLTHRYVQKMVSARNKAFVWNLKQFRKELKYIIEEEEEVVELMKAAPESAKTKPITPSKGPIRDNRAKNKARNSNQNQVGFDSLKQISTMKPSGTIPKNNSTSC